MDGATYGLGEVVFASEDLYNDGSLPEIEDGALVAAPHLGTLDPRIICHAVHRPSGFWSQKRPGDA